MFLGIANAISGIKSGGLSFIKDNLKLYLDFKSNKSDTLKFPSEGSTSFDGSDDYIDTGYSTNHTNISVSMWFNKDALGSFKRLFDDTNTSYASNLQINITDTNIIKVRSGNGSNSETDIDTTFTISAGTWHHLVVTRENLAVKIYVDGDLKKSGNVSAFSAPLVSWKIGSSGTGTANFNGKIANVGLWSRILEPEEIQSIMNKSYSQLKGVEKTSLVSWWALDSQSDGLIQPATGETLGTNLFTDSTFDLSGTQSASTTGTHWTTGSAWTIANGEAIYNATAHENRLELPSSTFKDAGLYKFSFTVSDANTKAGIKIKAGGNDIIPTAYYDNGSHVIYYHQANAYGSAKTLKIEGRNDVHGAFKLQNASWELVTSNTGVVTGATTTTSVYGGNAPILPRAVDVAKEGQADNIGNGSASFNGTSDYVDLSPLPFSGDASFTISAWIKPTTKSGGNAVVAFGNDTSTNVAGKRVALYFNSGKPFFAFWGSDVIHDVDVIQVNEWQHFAITYSGGNTTTANSAIYLNGVSLSLTGGASSPLNLDSSDFFHIGADQVPGQYSHGLISQVGIWQGALTQAQIQSVMESTSYAKIPADVKSTLGSELFDADASTFDSGTHSWVVYGSNTVANDSGALKITYVNDARGAYLWLKDASDLSSNLTIGKTYKFTFDAKVSSGASVDVTISTLSGSPQVITETSFTTKSIYFTAENTTTTYIDTRNMGSGEIIYLDNLSLKEVINDIVAYYPLDGNSSANGVTQNVTTGEVLGSELIPDGEFTDTSLWDAGTDVAIGTGISFVNGQAVWATSGVVEIKQDITINSGKLYKVVLDIDSVTSGTIRNNVGSYGGSFTTAGVKTEYITGSGSRFYLVGFSGFNGVLNSVSVKEVLSNTGVLK